ncbi:hypothetical protein PPSIR1_19214 [Plesiocystis pacifica SIR-1]|uniref:Uncharacterized protein n=1 Tax=Plesiocystis pacifica SIR-1 TaxID=391625 RepID=A6G808_9BACT|nr:hypothetical protein [Plesiocystis pacifica]EDM77970.1 hypothetical protein PPSIR1_19214 [Plesiocystis pacifica SIR-1]
MLVPRSEAGRILTATASELAASSPDDSLEELQTRMRRAKQFKSLGWSVLVATVLAYAYLEALGIVVGVVFGGVAGVLWWRERDERRACGLSYDRENPEILARLGLAQQVGQALASARGLWHIHHSVKTSDWKRNAGADTLLRRTSTRSAVGSLAGIVLDIEAWSVPVGPQQLLWLPDRLLIWDGRSLAGVPYDSLQAEATATRFIENGRVPKDARVVDKTWQFTNKRGGPDRRFKNNRQLPVVAYGRLALRTTSGLCIDLQTSTVEAATAAASAVQALSARARMDALNPAPS